MNVNQIYSVVNSIAQNMKLGTMNVIDTTSFVNFGKDVLSSDVNKEIFYSTLVDRIGRTIVAIREYKADTRRVLVDSFTFGSVLQKISFELQNAETTSQWEIDGENPYTVENNTPKNGIRQKLFAQTLPTFSYKDVVLDNQLESAFINAEAMAGFINGIYTRMYNALEISKEGLANSTVNALVCEVYTETTADAPINTRRMRNVLAEWNALHADTQLTADTALENKDFLKYVCVQMGTLIPFIGKLTKMYNDGTVERVTKEDNLIVEVNTEFEKMYSVYLQSDTFHDELVKLPNFKSVPYWYTPSNPTEIKGKNSNGEDKTISNVLAIFRDSDSCLCTLEREKLISLYDQWNARTKLKLSADQRYIVDTSENCVVFYMA